MSDLIANNSWCEKREKNFAKELERIICTVAKLILSDIRSTDLETDFYTFEDEINDIKTCESLLPTSLRKFIEVLMNGRLKRSVIRPRFAILFICD